MHLIKLLIINLKFIVIISNSYEEYLCDINVNYKICLDGGALQLSKSYQDADLFGYWNFDHEKFIDHSVNKHLTQKNNLNSIFSVSGFGNAVEFTKDNDLSILFVPPLISNEFTVSFLLYFDEILKIATDNSQIIYCDIMNLFDGFFEEQTGIQLKITIDQQTRQIIAKLYKSTVKKKEETILLRSNFRVQPQIWYRVYIVYKDGLQLFVNGYQAGMSQKQFQANWKNVIIGYAFNKDNSKCSSSFTFDSLQVYKKALDQYFILAASQQFNNYADIVQFRCEDCTNQAAFNCKGGFHLCTTIELYSFAINVARDMGWSSSSNPKFWSMDTNQNMLSVNDNKGIGLCCKDIIYV